MWLLTFSGAEEDRSKYICFECNQCNPNFPSKNNFQCRDESNAGFTQLCSVIGPETCAILSTNQIQTSKNRASVIRVFPRFRQFGQFACFHSEFSLANDNMNLCSDWSLGFDFSTLNSCSKIN